MNKELRTIHFSRRDEIKRTHHTMFSGSYQPERGANRDPLFALRILDVFQGTTGIRINRLQSAFPR